MTLNISFAFVDNIRKYLNLFNKKFYFMKELPTSGYLYNNVRNDVTSATRSICWDACGITVWFVSALLEQPFNKSDYIK